LTIDFRQTLETARPLFLELSSWQKGLPSSFEADGSRPLKLSFYAAQFAIFRALLRTFENPESTSHLKESEKAEFGEARQVETLHGYIPRRHLISSPPSTANTSRGFGHHVSLPQPFPHTLTFIRDEHMFRLHSCHEHASPVQF
jgi:hypothetical protein